MKTVKIYTIREAIEELEAIRKESIRLPGNLALSSLVSELASVVGWLARHIEQQESEGLYVDEP